MIKKATTPKRKTQSASSAVNDRTSHVWTFLSNHAHVLAVLHSDPDKVLREVAIEVGITERAVQRIIQDLEEGGFIKRERVGRRNRYHILKGNHFAIRSRSIEKLVICPN